MNKNKPIHLLVTTVHKGVFAGWGKPKLGLGDTITLTQTKMCIYWSAGCKGVLGLAVVGPIPGCKISPAVESIILTGVTSVSELSQAASIQWTKEIWA